MEEVAKNLEQYKFLNDHENWKLRHSRWEKVKEGLLEKGRTSDIEILEAEKKRGRLNGPLQFVFDFLESDSSDIEEQITNGYSRMILHVIAEALGLAHIGSRKWSYRTSSGYDSPKCKHCSIHRSFEEERTTGIKFSKNPLKTTRHQQESYIRNRDHAQKLGIRCISPSRKLYIK